MVWSRVSLPHMNKHTYERFVMLGCKSGIVVFLMRSRDVLQFVFVWKLSSLHSGHEMAGGQPHKSNRRLKEMGFEVVMVIEALWPKQSWGYYPKPTLLLLSWSPSPPPLTPTEVWVFSEVNLTRFFMNYFHHTHTPCWFCALFSFSHTQTHTQRQWSKELSLTQDRK